LFNVQCFFYERSRGSFKILRFSTLNLEF